VWLCKKKREKRALRKKSAMSWAVIAQRGSEKCHPSGRLTLKDGGKDRRGIQTKWEKGCRVKRGEGGDTCKSHTHICPRKKRKEAKN